MAGSDVVIGWVKDSKGYLTDRYADAQRLPPLDKENNYVLTGFEESDKKTVLKFNRKFDTCDPKDRKIKQGTTKVVFAYHTEDPTSEDDIKKHTYKGSRSILLLNNLDKKQVNETGWKELIIQNKNVTIPKQRTTYWCSLIKAQPAIKTKHHITKFEPYTQKGNEGIVHHLLVYECPGNYNDSHYGPGFECHDRNMPFLDCYSKSIVAAWGIGGEAFYYPQKAGYPIGTKDSPKSYMLELHYDNPEMIEGRKDSSGVRFYYTPNLREYDAGIFAVGEAVTKFMMIPPKQKSWLTVGYCPKECYQQNLDSTKLPEKGINVFAAFLHTHLQGRATWTKHIRKGIELPEIARDDNYDFNFQDIQVLRKEVHIQPGDDLIHYCKYETMDRDKRVEGGISTSEEMCLDFLFYYPRMVNASQYCSSIQPKPVQNFIEKHFPLLNVTSKWSNPLIGENITWTKQMVSDLRREYDENKMFTAICSPPEDTGNYKTLPVPEITRPLPPKKSKCGQPSAESNSSLMAASRAVALSLFILYLMFM
ncbi:DBH-like monooxygenase protein 1 [Desmophyllum pertusum]|uniref:DBH-like monooxygenase protein 1 n=1 Tax=Desmophyllum pertusum TaxID=174260 RepID=A0A9X0CQH6_9CNID|nr:DBH-like monooxygenase protein 1 [Desmophyllum pertusum]